jgi:hypothetical protein
LDKRSGCDELDNNGRFAYVEAAFHLPKLLQVNDSKHM